MRRVRLHLPIYAMLSAAGAVAACSLVNPYDDVNRPPEATYTVGPKVEGPSLSSDAGGDAGDKRGVLVVGGVVLDDAGPLGQSELAVLDSATGHQIGAREKMVLAGVAHDAPRDLWYLFEAQSSFSPARFEAVTLHVRRLDAASGTWTELSRVPVPTLSYYDAIAPTNERLTYIAHPGEGGASPRLVTLDTSNPAAPSLLADQPIAVMPVGMSAIRSGAGPGGQLTMVNVGRDGDCVDAGPMACAVRVRRYLVPNGGVPEDLGSFLFGTMSSLGVPSFGAIHCGGGPDELFVLPAREKHTVHRVSYQSTEAEAIATLTMTSNLPPPNAPINLRRMAVDETRRLVFLVEANNDTNVYAVPLDAKLPPVKAALRHSGQAVYYDPTSETVFAPFNQGDGYTFSAFRVTGTGSSVQLKERGPDDWDPPANLRPVLLGIRNPPQPTCL